MVRQEQPGRSPLPPNRLSGPLQRRTILALAVLFAAALALILIYTSRLETNLVNALALEEAAGYTRALSEFRTLYTSEVVTRVQSRGIEVTHDYLSKEGAIPLPATLTILLGEHLGTKESGVRVRLFSDYPFPWRVTGGRMPGMSASKEVSNEPL